MLLKDILHTRYEEDSDAWIAAQGSDLRAPWFGTQSATSSTEKWLQDPVGVFTLGRDFL